MQISTHTGLVGLLLALSAVTATATVSQAASSTTVPDGAIATPATVEARLTRLTDAIRQMETQLPSSVNLPQEIRVAAGFANTVGRGGWVNGGGGGGFANAWGNGGGFLNRY